MAWTVSRSARAPQALLETSRATLDEVAVDRQQFGRAAGAGISRQQ